MISVKQYIDDFVKQRRFRHESGNYLSADNVEKELEAVDWNELLSDAGYYSVDFGINSIGSIDGVLEIMEWLKNTVGEQHYIWTGQQVWFDRAEDRVLFILIWK